MHTVVRASVPLLEPPGWAIAQRELFDLLDYAWRRFARDFTGPDGRWSTAVSSPRATVREHALRVPDDVSVLAVAADRVATTVHPQVSAADVPAEEMGRHAVDALLRLIANPAGRLAHILLSPPFADRGSVAGPAAGMQDSAGVA